MKIITLLLISFSSLVFAQTPKEDFKVLSHKGANTVNNKPLSTGTKLFSSDQIMVSVGGYIGLLHKTGKTLELRQPGTYTVAEISQKAMNKDVGILVNVSRDIIFASSGNDFAEAAAQKAKAYAMEMSNYL